MEFLLFPMVHIGTTEYYAQVRSRLLGCDVILFEGVRSFRGRLLALSYKLAAHRRRLGLVTQRDALDLKSIAAARKVRADIDTDSFGRHWSRIPWHLRLLVLVYAPLYGAYLYLTASRASIARRTKSEDLESAADILRDEKLPGFNDAIDRSRNAVLVAAIEEEIQGTARKVAIVYGGSHMRAATRVLMGSHQYRVVHSEWLTVFDRE